MEDILDVNRNGFAVSIMFLVSYVVSCIKMHLMPE